MKKKSFLECLHTEEKLQNLFPTGYNQIFQMEFLLQALL